MGKRSTAVMALAGIISFLLPLGVRWMILHDIIEIPARFSRAARELSSVTQPPQLRSPSRGDGSVINAVAEESRLATASTPAAATGAENNAVQTVSWLNEPDGAGSVDALPSPSDVLWKMVLGTLGIGGFCFVAVKASSIWSANASTKKHELQITDSIALSRDAAVKLIQIGSERVVVAAHDRNGLKGMVVLPDRFADAVANEIGRHAESPSSHRTIPNDRGLDLLSFPQGDSDYQDDYAQLFTQTERMGEFERLRSTLEQRSRQ